MKGCQFQKKRFTVPMSSGEKAYTKCERCKAQGEKCKICQDGSEFIDRGFVIIKR
jgi:recombinational DNA repair protein RecR